MIQIVSILISAALGGLFTAWLGNWKQRRHDYGSLLEVIVEQKATELRKRIELAALVASRRVLPILESIRDEANRNQWSNIPADRWEAWRASLFGAMRRDLNPLLRFW